MKLFLLWLPIAWLNPTLNDELTTAQGAFDYERFWNPDYRVKVDDYHIWCWGDAVLKFTDEDVVLLVRGKFPKYTPVIELDKQYCGE